MKKLLSVVTPVLNEEMNIFPLYEAVRRVMDPLAAAYDLEFVFTDNHSSDATFDKLRELAARDSRVRAYRFSRNVGYQRSILTGYRMARGDAVIQLDCDLQDPPEMIPGFLDLWRQGYKVVYGVRKTRAEGPFITFLRRGFYWLINKISDDELPRDAGDFRLIDRVIVDNLTDITDVNVYLRGRIAAMGFDQIGVEYARRERREGKSKFNYKGNLKLAMDAITAHSAMPLRLASFFGFTVTVCAFLAAIGYFVAYLAGGSNWPPGFASIFFLQLVTLGVLSFFQGILGEYVHRYIATGVAPKVIIEKSVGNAGIPADDAQAP